METIANQSKAVKKALVAAGYKCSVRKGTVGWIYVDIQDRVYTAAEDKAVLDIAVKAAGRQTWGENKDLSIEFTFRPFVAAICPKCGATGTDINRRLGPDDIIRDYCRKCGKEFPVQ